MTPRALLTVALRVMGLWFLLTGVVAVAYSLAAVSWPDEARVASGLPLNPYPTVIAQVVYSLYGGVLLFCAPSIASWFCKPDQSNAAPGGTASLSAGSAFQISLRLLGIYVFVSAIDPVGRVVANLLKTSVWQVELERINRVDVIHAVLYLLVAAFLFFGSRRIIAWFPLSGPNEKATENMPPQG